MTFVLDNSVVMRWCFGDGTRTDLDHAAAIAQRLIADTALVPAIWSLEVANVLARAESTGVLTADLSDAFLTTLLSMRITTDLDTARHALGATLRLARQYRLSSYDAAYLELALRERIPLATLDAGLRKAATRSRVKLI